MVGCFDQVEPAAAVRSPYSSDGSVHLQLANSYKSLSQKRKRRRFLTLSDNDVDETTTTTRERTSRIRIRKKGDLEIADDLTTAPLASLKSHLTFHFRLPLIILLLLKLSLLFLLVSDLPPASLCLNPGNQAPVTFARLADLGSQATLRSGRKTFMLPIMEPASSIFGSLLGGNSQSNNNNNGNSAAQQQLLMQQQQAADLHQSYKNGQTSDKVTLPGDILLGGLFPIHMKGTKVECGEINRDRGIQRLEAMLYALDRINEDSNLLPGIKLGAILLDSCSSSTYALNQSLEFIRASINTVESSAFECKDKSAPRPKYGSKMIAGVIGGSYSEVSLQVANLLRLFRIPQVSYASTGTALSDKTLYDLFARTVPSDMFQARAIADIVLKLKWSYVSLVSSEGLYGDSGSREFMKQASVRQICIATHEKVSPTTDNNAYDLIVSNLLKRNATGVVLFTRAEDTRELLLAVKRANLFHNFAWVAADGWGTHQKLVEGVEEIAWGAITVELSAKTIPGFDQYMKELTPVRNTRNPWFSEYWQEWFNCQLDSNLVAQQQVASGLAASYRWPLLPTSGAQEAEATSGADYDARKRRRKSLASDQPTPSAFEQCQQTKRQNSSQNECAKFKQVNGTANSAGKRSKRAAEEPNGWQKANNVKQRCSPNLQISESNGYRQEQKVQFVVDAVYAMAHALHRAWYNLCDAQTAVVCEALKELNGGDFYSKYLLNVSFEDLAGSEVKFDERGDGLGRYNIYNFRQLRPPQAQATGEPKQPAPADTSAELSGSAESAATANYSRQSAPDARRRRQAKRQVNATGDSETETEQDTEHLLAASEEELAAEGVAAAGAGAELAAPASATAKSSIAANGALLVGQTTEQVPPSGRFEYWRVGRWTESDYKLQLDDIEFIRGDSSVPESYCSRPCELGQAKIMRAGDHCCWICKTCAPYEYLPDEFSCQDCGIGKWPIHNKTSCYDLPLQYLRWDSPYSLATLAFACLGIACTLFVIFIFIRYLDTPVVKASGRELSFILLAGTASCHLSTFVLLAKPTIFICGSQRFLVNFGFALMYASLLVKTNRISRIFNCARKSAKRPSFISPKSQMLITGILVAIQIFLTIVWFVFEPPGIRAEPPEGKRDQLILKCRAKGKSFIISLVYNMILITTCTVYAIKTRKIPENFNESKFIGFTMYTTIVIWMAFVTMFFGTHNSFETQILTMCICISLSAYSTLFCLFGPKISIILFHPDKNVRKLTMNSAQYKRPFKPVSSMASMDGRNNTTGATYNGPQTDGGSGGPMSTTSNVLNPAESQAGRLHESSVASNVVNSNSAGSNCSNSQKTPTTLSQQLVLMGATCANCGAHQLAQAPISAAGHLHQQTAGAQVKLNCASTSGKLVGGEPARQVSGGPAHATILKSSLAGQSASQTRLAADCAAGKALASTSGGRSSSILVPAGHSRPAATAKVVHNKISGSASGGGQLQQPARGLDLFKRMSSDEHLLTSGSAGRRQQMASLSRLNELNSTTSSHCGNDESISSLANDSFVNTSQENTPCTGGGTGALPGGGQSRSAQHYFSGKGSDSMLWNQSVYSIDYCSDCCPSYCHCSCPACSSSNGCELAELPDGTSQQQQQPICVHTAAAGSGPALLEAAAAQQADTEPDEFDSALCDQSLAAPADHAQAVRHRRKSEEPSKQTAAAGNLFGAPAELAGYYYERDEFHSQQQRAIGVKIRDANLKPTRRSQTMEMRTIVVDKSGAGRLKLRQSVDEETLVQAAGNSPAASKHQQLSKQQQQQQLGGKQVAAPPLVYALQAAASSAYTVAQMAASSQPKAAELHYGQQQQLFQTTSTKDKSSEKGPVGEKPARQRQSAATSRQELQPHLTGGAIQAGLEMVKSVDSIRRKSADQRRHQQHRRESSCLSYHDDYEYSYGLVHSNSDSENYYPDELSGDGDTSAGSFVRDETSDEGAPAPGRTGSYDDYYEENVAANAAIGDNDDDDDADDDDDDFNHDGRLTLNKPPGETNRPRDSQRAACEQASARHRLAKSSTATVKYRGSTQAGSSAAAAPLGQRQQRLASVSKELQLDEHRINSVTLIAATLSAGGAIVESSGGGGGASSLPPQQQQQQQQQPVQPLAGGDNTGGTLTGINDKQQRQQQKQEQKHKDSNQSAQVVDDEKQAEQMGYLTTL